MKVYQIEDTIVAYFDGRLNDSESAELMHRVSISPEIRDLFEQHQLLRRMSVRAARNVTVSPNVEDAVFANIASLAAKEKKKPVVFWSMRRSAIAAAVLLLLGTGAVIGLHSNESNNVPTAAHNTVTITSDVARTHEVASNDVNMDVAIPPAVASIPTTHRVTIETVSRHSEAPMQPSELESPISSLVDARTVQAEKIQPPTVISHGIGGLLVTSQETSQEMSSPIELGLANSSIATAVPGTAGGIAPFQNFILTANYVLDPRNLAGARIEQGRFNTSHLSASEDATYYASTLQPRSLIMFGAYYEHREYIGRGNFMVAGDIGAGLFAGGNYVSLGLGGRLPIGDHFLAAATVSLTRKHDGDLTKAEVFEHATGPVIFDGADIHNTLITRIEYGLSYRF